MRIWVFVEGDKIPSFNSSGYVNATDSQGTLIRDLRLQKLQTAGFEGISFTKNEPLKVASAKS